jgi:hypothetical protein
MILIPQEYTEQESAGMNLMWRVDHGTYRLNNFVKDINNCRNETYVFHKELDDGYVVIVTRKYVLMCWAPAYEVRWVVEIRCKPLQLPSNHWRYY